MRSWIVGLIVACLWASTPPSIGGSTANTTAPSASVAEQAAPGGSSVVIGTAKGPIEIQLFRAEAPKSTGRVIELVKSGFYRGLRVHRVSASLAQFGDPLTRDVSKKDYWGTGGTGKPLGVAEISKKRTHLRGTVGFAHSGSPQVADSQLYIMKAASPSLDGKYAIVGQVTKGMEVVDKLQVGDVISLASLK